MMPTGCASSGFCRNRRDTPLKTQKGGKGDPQRGRWHGAVHWLRLRQLAGDRTGRQNLEGSQR